MDFVVVCCINLRFYLSRKVFNRLLPAMLRHYKDKRPPPAASEMLNRTISIWLSHSIIIPFNWG